MQPPRFGRAMLLRIVFLLLVSLTISEVGAVGKTKKGKKGKKSQKNKKKIKGRRSSRGASSGAVACAVCEYLVTTLDSQIKLSLSQDRSFESGFRLNAKGVRETQKLPYAHSQTGFMEILEQACAPERLLGQGIVPMPAESGETEGAFRLLSTDSEWWLRTKPKPRQLTADDAEELQRLHDACQMIVSEHEDAIVATVRDVPRDRQIIHIQGRSGSGKVAHWTTAGGLRPLKEQLCVKSQLCPPQRVWAKEEAMKIDWDAMPPSPLDEI